VHLDLLDAVDDEHVLQVLHGSVHPVVEGRRPLGELQVKLVDGLPQLLHALHTHTHTVKEGVVLPAPPPPCCCFCVYLQGVPPLLGEGAQVVPLVTDALAAAVDRGGVVVVQLAGGDEAPLKIKDHFNVGNFFLISKDTISSIRDFQSRFYVRHADMFIVTVTL